MNMVCKIVLAVAALGPPGTLGGINLARAENVPDALSVEWEGKNPCEKLFEDAHVRMARCTFPPGAMHVCHILQRAARPSREGAFP